MSGVRNRKTDTGAGVQWSCRRPSASHYTGQNRVLPQMEAWIDDQITDLPTSIRIEILKRYPPKPWYMRGENYSPVDLNEEKRIAWIDGYTYAVNNES